VASKIYILGPMRGIPFYNFPAFDKAAAKLREAGYEPVSPADIDRECGFDAMALPHDFDWGSIPASLHLKDIISRDLLAIVNDADGYYCLPRWTESVGATAEWHVCQWKAIPEIKI